jgi:hypothetical protein
MTLTGVCGILRATEFHLTLGPTSDMTPPRAMSEGRADVGHLAGHLASAELSSLALVPLVPGLGSRRASPEAARRGPLSRGWALRLRTAPSPFYQEFPWTFPPPQIRATHIRSGSWSIRPNGTLAWSGSQKCGAASMKMLPSVPPIPLSCLNVAPEIGPGIRHDNRQRNSR